MRIRIIYNDKIIELEKEKLIEIIKQEEIFLDSIIDQDKDIIKECLKINGEDIIYANQNLIDEETIIIAIKNKPEILQYIRNQSENLCIEAVKIDGLVLQYVINQTYEICLEAVKQNGCSLSFVNEKFKDYGLHKLAIENNPWTLSKIDNPSDILIKTALNLQGDCLQFVQNQTNEMCEIAIKNDSDSFIFVKRQTPELCELAVSLDLNNIVLIKDKAIKEKLINNYIN